MKMNITRSGIKILPENDQDEAYIKDTLGLIEKDMSIKCVRKSPMGLPHAIGWLEIEKESK